MFSYLPKKLFMVLFMVLVSNNTNEPGFTKNEAEEKEEEEENGDGQYEQKCNILLILFCVLTVVLV